ncbi:MAG: DUF5071 domain-containing protein [Candidatus Dormibacteria bacterium]|jgi:hypothetical protein
MDPNDLIPRDKGDIPRAEAAVRAGYPAVEPILGELLEWLQDLNWPVAGVLVPFLESIGPVDALLHHVRAVLRSDDDVWKYWVLGSVVDAWEADGILLLRPDLERMATQPTLGEITADVWETARALLTWAEQGGGERVEEEPRSAEDLFIKADAFEQLDDPWTAIRVYGELIERFGDAAEPSLRRMVAAAQENRAAARARLDAASRARLDAATE